MLHHHHQAATASHHKMGLRKHQADQRDDKSEEDLVSLVQVKELLQQQKDMFNALLQQQQENFKGFVQIIMDSTNSRLDAFIREVQEIKTSIQFTQKEVDDIKAQNKTQSECSDSMQTDIMKICDCLSAVTDKRCYCRKS